MCRVHPGGEMSNSVSATSGSERDFDIRFEQNMSGIAATGERYVIFRPAISRRTFLAGGTAVGASLLLDQKAEAERFGAIDGPPLKEYDIATNGISLRVTEQGQGPAVLFCHGFPDTSYTWRRQMKAIASAGYRGF